MARYKEYNQAQGQFITVDFESQIREGTFEYALNHIVDFELNLTEFDSQYKNDETGAPAFDPRVLLKIILYAYSQGIVTSRKIAHQCDVNVMFMALSGNIRPHYTTIADFISTMDVKATKIFRDVVLMCDRLGLIGKSMFAIDGCKISSNAAKEWSGTKKDFERKKKKIESSIKTIVRKHKYSDEKNKVPKRMRELEKNGVKNLKQKVSKIQKWLKESDDRLGLSGKIVQSNITDNESAKMATSHGVIQGYNGIAAVDSKHQVIVEAQASSSGSERSSMKPMVEGIKKVLNKDVLKETKLTADTGFFSEDTLKYIDNENIDAYIPDPLFRKRDIKLQDREIHNRPTDRKKTLYKRKYYGPDDFKLNEKIGKLICPAGESLYRSGDKVKIGNYIGIRYKGRDSKCPSCSLRSKCLRNSKTKIRQVYKLNDPNLQEEEKTFSQKMREKIDTPKGRFMYSRRMGIVEPVFAHICHSMKLKYFTLRSKKKVNAQWNLFATVHNMKKLFQFSPLFA